MLNMSKLSWLALTSVKQREPLASEVIPEYILAYTFPINFQFQYHM